MSGGDKDNPFPFTWVETETILRLPIVTKQLRRRRLISVNEDIPYLAGYSRDGKIIYIDRDMPESFSYRGRTINTNRFLILHEEMEKSLIDALHEADDFDRRILLDLLRMTSLRDQIYFHTHGVATAAELHAVGQALGQAAVADYNRFMRRQVKRAEDERIRKVPLDLDMTPYQGNDAQDRRLRAAMARANKH